MSRVGARVPGLGANLRDLRSMLHDFPEFPDVSTGVDRRP
jgi:hypothetical protein